MNRLLRPAPPPPDVRPAMLSVWVALLLLLIPSLLFTTSEQKLVGLDIGLAGAGVAPSRAGPVERVTVRLGGDGRVEVQAEVRRADVGASTGEVLQRVVPIAAAGRAPDFAGLQRELASLKALDPGLRRVVLAPAASLTAQQVVALVDAVRSRDGQELLPDVVFAAEGAP